MMNLRLENIFLTLPYSLFPIPYSLLPAISTKVFIFNLSYYSFSSTIKQFLLRFHNQTFCYKLFIFCYTRSETFFGKFNCFIQGTNANYWYNFNTKHFCYFFKTISCQPPLPNLNIKKYKINTIWLICLFN